MKKQLTTVYKRDPKTREKHGPYEQKFAGLIKLCQKAKTDKIEHIIVTWPWVLGDNYEELIESLSRLAEAGLTIHIIERSGKSAPDIARN
jgi:hypothetical protein